MNFQLLNHTYINKLLGVTPITMPYSNWSEYVKETKEFLDKLGPNNIIRINSEKYFCNETRGTLLCVI